MDENNKNSNRFNSAAFTELLNQESNKSTLRIMTCGSVDDGKSTLIGTLLYATNNVFKDQTEQLIKDSAKYGTKNGQIDFSLLLDGLSAEREQGITIDVAYRFFSTPERNFIIADTPGHAQYTKNMVTAASNSQLALLLIDAKKNISIQTKRHLYLLFTLGVKNICFIINKMDLVDYDENVFNSIKDTLNKLAQSVGITTSYAIPNCARNSENIIENCTQMPWYKGKNVFQFLNDFEIIEPEIDNFQMSVQYVNRTNNGERYYCGTITSGAVKIGDTIKILPQHTDNIVSKIIGQSANTDIAYQGEAISLSLQNQTDCSRGNVICNENNSLSVSEHFEAMLFWVSTKPMMPRRNVWLQIGCQMVNANIGKAKYRIDLETFEQTDAKSIENNEIACVQINTSQPIICEQYNTNKSLGAFTIIDKFSNETLAAGIITNAKTTNSNNFIQVSEISTELRARQKRQKPLVLWFTGLSGAGKSTIANEVDKELFKRGYHSFILDGDNIRSGLCSDLSFSEIDRIENIRRLSHVANLMCDAGLIVLTSFISPFEEDRQLARELIKNAKFIEIFVKAPLEIVEARDTKGLYKLAREGKINNFTGISSPYEEPKNPEIIIDTANNSIADCASKIIDFAIDVLNN